MKKSFFKYILYIITLLFLSGCGKEYIFVDPVYPKLSAPRKVPKLENTFVRKGCLWYKNHNTNLCGEDLKVILTHIKKLRSNEDVCQAKIEAYNGFVKKKLSESEK